MCKCLNTCVCSSVPTSPLIDWTKPVQTRNGAPLRVLCTDASAGMPVVCLTKEGATYRYHLNGQYNEEGPPVPSDAINCPPPKRKIVVLLFSKSNLPISCAVEGLFAAEAAIKSWSASGYKLEQKFEAEFPSCAT